MDDRHRDIVDIFNIEKRHREVTLDSLMRNRLTLTRFIQSIQNKALY